MKLNKRVLSLIMAVVMVPLKGWHRAVERAKNWIDPEDEE